MLADPRGRVVAVAYSLTPTEKLDTDVAWWALTESVQKLAYDHNEILRVALGRIRSRIRAEVDVII